MLEHAKLSDHAVIFAPGCPELKRKKIPGSVKNVDNTDHDFTAVTIYESWKIKDWIYAA